MTAFLVVHVPPDHLAHGYEHPVRLFGCHKEAEDFVTWCGSPPAWRIREFRDGEPQPTAEEAAAYEEMYLEYMVEEWATL